MHIARDPRGRTRSFYAQILTIAAVALIAIPALAAGPGGPVGPVVAPPKPPTTPAPPAVVPPTVVAPTAPVIPQMIPTVSAVTGGPGAPNDTAKNDTSADASGLQTRSDTASTAGNGMNNKAQGIADQANAGNLSSYLRIPDTQFTPQPHDQDDPIPGIDVVVRKKPSGAALHLTTDGKGNASIGKLARGASYDIQISGKDLEPALDRVAGGKSNGGTAQPQHILIGLLLPAVQQVREASMTASPTERAFARGSKDQGIKLTIAIAKDGKATVDWGDGSGGLPIGNIKDGNALSIRFTAPVARQDANSVMSQESQTRLGTAPGSGGGSAKGPMPVDDANSAMQQDSQTR
jgi:hypothetical protein